MSTDVPVHRALPPLTDSVSAATSAITADPSFKAALAAAISSIIGGAANQGNNGGAVNILEALKVNSAAMANSISDGSGKKHG